MRPKYTFTRLMMMIWLYFNQPIFKPKWFLNLLMFSHTDDRVLLERCYVRECEIEQQRMLLERCWQYSCEIL